MNVGKANSVKIKPFSVAVVHVRSSCTLREIGQIVRLKNGILPVREWISYVEPANMDKAEPFSPENAVRRPFAPMRGCDLDYPPRGGHIILGGSLPGIQYIFPRLCGVNLMRFEAVEFHSSIDIMGSAPPAELSEEEIISYLKNPANLFCQHLDMLFIGRKIGSEVFFDGDSRVKILGYPKRPVVRLHWYSSLERMADLIRQAAMEEG
jgi:hypothetical protein